MPQTCEYHYTLPETGLDLEHVQTQTSRYLAIYSTYSHTEEERM